MLMAGGTELRIWKARVNQDIEFKKDKIESLYKWRQEAIEKEE